MAPVARPEVADPPLFHQQADRGADPLFYTSWEGAFQTDDLATALERGAGDGGALLLSGINGGVASSCLMIVLVLVCGLWLYGAKYACPSLLKKKLQAVNVVRMRQVRAHSPILAMWIAQSFSQTGLLSLRASPLQSPPSVPQEHAWAKIGAKLTLLTGLMLVGSLMARCPGL